MDLTPQARSHVDPPSVQATTPLFAVGTRKLIVMCIVTFGLYQFFWSFEHWRALRGRRHVTNALLTLFSGLSNYFLFARIKEMAQRRRITPGYHSAASSLTYLVLLNLYRLPDPWWVVTFASCLPLLAVQTTANDVNEATVPGSEHRNDALGRWNLVTVGAGGLLFLAALYGVFFLPESAP